MNVIYRFEIFKGSRLFMVSVNYSGESPFTHEQKASLKIFKLDIQTLLWWLLAEKTPRAAPSGILSANNHLTIVFYPLHKGQA